jgi:hypothetical protein
MKRSYLIPVLALGALAAAVFWPRDKEDIPEPTPVVEEITPAQVQPSEVPQETTHNSLEKTAVIPARNSDATMYFFLQKHPKFNQYNLDEPRELNCQIGIYRTLETLFNQGRLDGMFAEGQPSEYIQFEDWDSSEEKILPEQIRENREAARSDSFLSSGFLITGATGSELFGFNHLDTDFHYQGWELYSLTEREEGKEESLQLHLDNERYYDLRELIEQGTITENNPEYIEVSERLRKNMCDTINDARIRTRRSVEFPIEEAQRRGIKRYAVTNGVGHETSIVEEGQTIYTIMESMDPRPEIHVYRCDWSGNLDSYLANAIETCPR